MHSVMAVCKVDSPLLVTRDVSWCFRPIFCWMRFLGIDLDQGYLWKKINLYGFLLVLWCVWSNVSATADTITNFDKPLNVTTSTTSWNIRIDFINHCFFTIGTYPVIFYVARYRWPRLWKKIEILESRAGLKLPYKQLRQTYYFAILPVFVVRKLAILNLISNKSLIYFLGDNCDVLQFYWCTQFTSWKLL